jgi:hypothetical protein
LALAGILDIGFSSFELRRAKKDQFDNYREITSRFESRGVCGHLIRKGEVIAGIGGMDPVAHPVGLLGSENKGQNRDEPALHDNENRCVRLSTFADRPRTTHPGRSAWKLDDFTPLAF